MRKKVKIIRLITFLLIGIFSTLSYAVSQVPIEKYDASKIDQELERRPDTQKPINELYRYMAEKDQYYARGMVDKDIEKFVLKSVIIDNNIIFSDQELKFAYQNKINKELRFEDLKEIADRITEKYQKAGYMLSFAVIPTQQVVDGILNIVIIEGIIDDVLLVDKTPKEYSKILFKYSQLLLKSKPMTRTAYSNFLTKANLLPGIEVFPNLIPSPDTFGASTLVLKVEEKPVDAAMINTNHIADVFGPNINNIQLAYNNIVNGFQAGVNYTRSSFSQHQKLAINRCFYKHFIGENGVSINIDNTNNFTHPYFHSTLDLLEYNGRSKETSFLVNYPLTQTFEKTLSINTGLHFKRNQTFLLHRLNTEDRTRALQIGIFYKLNSILFNKAGNSTVEVNLYKGLKGFGSTQEHGTNLSRQDAKIDFTKLNLAATRLQPVTSNIYVSALLEGQYAFNTLLSSEQYSFGGMRLGHGYRSNIINGDSGAAGKLELIYNKPIRAIATSQLYLSYDVGKAWLRQLLYTGQSKSDSASSIATGVRLRFLKHVHLDLSIAKPLTHLSNRNDRKLRYFLTFGLIK